jgi:hypothetical protein
MSKEALKLALEQPVQKFVCSTGLCHYKPAAPDLQAELEATNRQVEILSDALAESRREVAALKAVQEPVAWMDEFGNVFPLGAQRGPKYLNEPMKPLYTTPPAAQRQWVGLTDEQRNEIWSSYRVSFIAIDVIEAKLKELNT